MDQIDLFKSYSIGQWTKKSLKKKKQLREKNVYIQWTRFPNLLA